MIKWEATKKEKRAKQRLKAKEKRKEAKLNNIDLGPSRKELKRSRMENSKCKIGVVIDLSFDDLMISKDMGKVIKQILRVYTENRRSKAPMQLHLTSFEGRCKEEMAKHDGYEHWDINFHSETYLDIFPKEKLVYLSSESNNIIEKLEDDKVYIIGGLVDHNAHKGICYKKAVEEGINHGQLPINEYFSLQHRKVFTINQVFEILLRVSEGKSFKEAFLMVLPKRINMQPAKQKELDAKDEELMLQQEQGSYVGDVDDQRKVLIGPEGKFVVDIDKNILSNDVTLNCPVTLHNESNTLHQILPNKVDPLVSFIMVEKAPDSTYEMIGGLDKQIKEIKEVIELPIKHPELFDTHGTAQPKGVLLYGPPGTGKTLLARAVGHHNECTFIRVSGLELVQKFIGEGSRMVRELFVRAKEHAPSIIFMDDIDLICSSHIESGLGDNSKVQRTMLELLNQLDGLEATKNIKVIMATNRIDNLDPALLRPGRIDRKIEFLPPNEEARLDILKIHSCKMNLTRGINLRKIAELMPGASGTEVKDVCIEAGMCALRESRIHVTQEDFEMAVAKVRQKNSEKNMSVKKL